MLALLLAMVMVLGLCSMASAAAPTDRVQINNMMVDTSLLNTPSSIALTANAESEVYSLTPPINAVSVSSDFELVTGVLQAQRQYNLRISNVEAAALSSLPVTFSLGGSSVSGDITFTFESQTDVISKPAGSTFTVTLDLSNSKTEAFTVRWTGKDGKTYYSNCRLHADVANDANSSIADSVKVGEAVGDYTSTTVGGVARYNYKVALDNGPLTNLTVTVVLRTKNATATLGGAAPNTTTDGTLNRTLVFTNVDLSSSKDLVVTNSVGETSKTYHVSAYVKNQNITVYVAFRGYLAEAWYTGDNTYYNYISNGYGSGDDLSGSDASRIESAFAAMNGLIGDNAPESVDESSGRAIFNENSYIEITLNGSKTVKDALIEAIRKYNANEDDINPDDNVIAQHGAESNYIDYMTFNGNVLGEFDCGQGSGWMYTARTSRTDVASALPNAGVCYWPLANGMYIDFYYTAAYGMDFGYSIFDL